MKPALFFALTLSLSISACALDPYRIPDPSNIPLYGQHPRYPDYVKSLRCEITTFIVENKLRGLITEEASRNLKSEFLDSPNSYHRHVDIIRSNANIALDSKQLSYVFMDTKNIIVNNASFGLDWKKPSSDPKGTTLGQLLRSGDLRDAHFGPSYVDTLTAEFGTPIGVAQYSDLGPKESLINRNDPDVPRAVRYSTVYNQIPEEDAGFYCYKSLYPLETSVTKEDAAKDVQDLLLNSNRLAKFVNFDRIYI